MVASVNTPFRLVKYSRMIYIQTMDLNFSSEQVPLFLPRRLVYLKHSKYVITMIIIYYYNCYLILTIILMTGMCFAKVDLPVQGSPT